MRLRSLAFVAFLSTTLSAWTLAQPSAGGAASRFEGDWVVTMTCRNNTEKSAARGYKRQFPAQVKDGALRGEIGVAESAGWLRIEGPIGADGSARLDARGRTGHTDYAAAHPPPSSPYLVANLNAGRCASGRARSPAQPRLAL